MDTPLTYRNLTIPAWLQQLVLTGLVVACYSPSFFAEPSILDDARLLNSWQAHSTLSPSQLFRNAGGVYYRPLIGLSNWIDSTLWGMQPAALHAENILLHAVNSLLVFWLIKTLLPPETSRSSYLPLLGGLLFGLHPITTESVNWISGRTDLLAATGVLGAALCITAWQATKRKTLLLAAPLCLMVGLLTKEAAWGLLPALPFLLLPCQTPPPCGRPLWRNHLYPLLLCLALAFLLTVVTLSFWPALLLALCSWGIQHHCYSPDGSRSGRRSVLLTVVAAAVLAIILFSGISLCKRIMLANPFSPIGQALLNMVTAPGTALQLTSSATAFYLKKFFLPLPLSLAIAAIHPWYIFSGILVLFLLARLCALRTVPAVYFLTGLLLLAPALPLVYGTIAWTPYAERYVYIPSAFWTIGIVIAVCQIQAVAYRKGVLTVLTVLLPLTAVATFERSRTWQSNLALFTDTAQKAPTHLESQGIYMVVLGLNAQLDKARQQHLKIQSLAQNNPLAMKYDYNYAYLAYMLGHISEANDILIASLNQWAQLAGSHTGSFYRNEWQKMYDVHQRLAHDLGQKTTIINNRQWRKPHPTTTIEFLSELGTASLFSPKTLHLQISDEFFKTSEHGLLSTEK